MPKIYEVRDRQTKKSVYCGSFPQARRMLLEDPSRTVAEMEYDYKWQLVVMMNDVYRQGRDDVSSSVD